MPIDVFPCEDGHAQERSLLSDVLETYIPQQGDGKFRILGFF
jgi:hypothetical protein